MMITQARFRYLDRELETTAYSDLDEYMMDQYGLLDLYLEMYRIWIGESEEGNRTMIHNQIRNELSLANEYIKLRKGETYLLKQFPLEQVTNILYLNEFEKFCVLLGSAYIRDGKYRKWFQKLIQSEEPTIGFAKDLYGLLQDKSQRIYQACSNLNEKWQLIYNCEFQEEVPVIDRKLILQPELLSFLYGGDSLHNELFAYGKLYKGKKGQANANTLLFLEQQKEQLTTMLVENEQKFLLYLQGRKGSGKKYLAKCVADELAQAIVFIDCEALRYVEERACKQILHGMFLTARLQRAWICYDVETHEEIGKWIQEAQNFHLSCMVTSISELPIAQKLHQKNYSYYHMEIPLLSSEERIQAWEYLVHEKAYGEQVDCTMLGNKYVLSIGEILAILDTIDFKCAEDESVTNHTLIEVVQMHNRNVLDEYAKCVKTVFEWDDLIVEETVAEQLRMVCNRVLYRNVIGEQWGFYEKTSYGRGICTVFAGPPGTGKTMAAQVIAKELGYELYRIDLSKMVSKYIGETQKNISELFQKAKTMNVILFFDEADAFFSKRSEVSDSNDRHSNSEIAHLLQEIEEYEGICILATNLKSNMDDAFKRRIKYIVDFRLPNAETRLTMWKSMIPEKAPRSEELDIEYFAKEFELSGSEIKEIIMSAAFIAASEREKIANIHVIEALKISYLKYGKVLRTEDFRCLI